MKKKIISILSVLLIVVLIFISNIYNLYAFVNYGAGLKEFSISVVYLLAWLFLLFVGIKYKSKKLMGLYNVFWIIEVVYFTLYMFLLETPLAIIFFFGVLVFFMPLVGFDWPYDALLGVVGIDFLYGIIILPFLVVSIAMWVIGFVAKRKMAQMVIENK